MDKLRNDKLGNLFSKIRKESPSMSFENKLMQRVRREQLSIERKQKKLIVLGLTIGVLSAAIIPLIVLYLIGWSLPESSFDLEVFQLVTFPKFNWLHLSIGLVFLFLLAADDLIRKRLRKRHKNKSE